MLNASMLIFMKAELSIMSVEQFEFSRENQDDK